MIENLTLITEQEKKQIMVEMLGKLDVFFEKNSIKYYLAYGTLLGAVRHQGFIPWDDDVDLFVPRESFLRLLHICEEKREELLQLNLEIVEYGQNKKDYFKRFKLADTRTVMEEFGEEKSAVFIDVFPLDSMPYTNLVHKKRKYQKRILKIDNLLSLCNAGFAQGSGLKKNIYQVILFMYKLTGLNYNKRRLEKKLLKLTKWNTEGIMCSTEGGEGDKDFTDGNLWTDEVKLSFEGLSLNASAYYDKILTEQYGYYMQFPPVEDRCSHEYYTMYWRKQN